VRDYVAGGERGGAYVCVCVCVCVCVFVCVCVCNVVVYPYASFFFSQGCAGMCW